MSLPRWICRQQTPGCLGVAPSLTANSGSVGVRCLSWTQRCRVCFSIWQMLNGACTTSHLAAQRTAYLAIFTLRVRRIECWMLMLEKQIYKICDKCLQGISSLNNHCQSAMKALKEFGLCRNYKMTDYMQFDSLFEYHI